MPGGTGAIRLIGLFAIEALTRFESVVINKLTAANQTPYLMIGQLFHSLVRIEHS